MKDLRIVNGRCLHKPEPAQVYDFLRRHNALIVHFSGAPKGAGLDRGLWFPDDLKHVLGGAAMSGLSCSVVRPGDVFHGFERNATGCVGVVLGLKSSESLTAVDPDDCGSMEDKITGRREVLHERDIRIDDLERTFSERTAYNEWVVRDYDTLGIFAAPPVEVSVEVPINEIPGYPSGAPLEEHRGVFVPDIRQIPLNEIATIFDEQPVYTFKDGRVCQKIEAGFSPIDHSEIYPAA